MKENLNFLAHYMRNCPFTKKDSTTRIIEKSINFHFNHGLIVKVHTAGEVTEDNEKSLSSS